MKRVITPSVIATIICAILLLVAEFIPILAPIREMRLLLTLLISILFAVNIIWKFWALRNKQNQKKLTKIALTYAALYILIVIIIYMLMLFLAKPEKIYFTITFLVFYVVFKVGGVSGLNRIRPTR